MWAHNALLLTYNPVQVRIPSMNLDEPILHQATSAYGVGQQIQ